ncbi:thioredoxin domain-containing protein, partial [bacterium]
MDNSTSHRDTGAYLRRLIELDKSALPPDGGKQFNRLIFAGSPYLLQHAENPVDWHPWGEEAFARAKEEDKPVFLSIGYATCHWCHVMAHESFEDQEVADVLNRHFIPIKVDREERPDIDDMYMTVSQMMTGSGGWPLQVIMMPDRQPFFTVTYLPKHSRHGMPGLIELLKQISELWRTRRETVLQTCAAVLQSLGSLSVPSPGKVDGEEVSDQAYA